MALGQHRRAVGVFSSRQDAELALNELNRSGFPMDKVSIIAQDADRQDDIAGVDVSGRVGNKADEGAASGALTGGTLGGITGLLVGLGSLAIPGVGPVVLAGEVATTLATTLAGGAIGAAAGGLIGALIGLGIPEERARVYNNRVSRGDYLVIVDGTDAELARAEAILNGGGIQEWGIYNTSGVDSRTDYATTSPTSGLSGMPMGDPLSFAPATAMGVMSGMPVGDPLGITPGYMGYGTTTPMGEMAGTALNEYKRAVGVFSSRREVEYALHELRDAGFPMDRVSVVAKDADRGDDIAGVDVSDRVGNKADEGATTGAVAGGALGGLTGLLVGLGALAIPGIGPVMLAGAAATTIATTLSGGAIGAAAGGLLGALVGLGIPEEQARVYNERLSRGDYLVLVDGTYDEITRAEAILNNRGIQEFGIYDAPDVAPARTDYAATDVPVVETTRSDYPGSVVDTEPKISIVDRRDQTPDYEVVDRHNTPGVAPAPTGYAATSTPNRDTGMAIGRQRRAVGVFSNRRDAEHALTEQRNSGFPMDNVSVIARDADRNDQLAGADMSDRVGNKADEGATTGAVTGGAVGGLGGLLVGLGALAIPGIGPVMLAGAGATALATAVTGGAIGAAAGGLLGALVGLGIPEERARVYNDRVARGNYLVMVDGTDDEIRHAGAIYSNRGIQDWDVYDAPGVDTARTNYAATNAPVVDTSRTDYSAGVSDTGPNVTIVDRRDQV